MSFASMSDFFFPKKSSKNAGFQIRAFDFSPLNVNLRLRHSLKKVAKYKGYNLFSGDNIVWLFVSPEFSFVNFIFDYGKLISIIRGCYIGTKPQRIIIARFDTFKSLKKN